MNSHSFRRLLCLLLAVLSLLALGACGDLTLSDAIDIAEDVYDVYDAMQDMEQQSPDAEPSTPQEQQPGEPADAEPTPEDPELDPDGSYTERDDVALYIHLYSCLPPNFISKSEARELGWDGGSLEPYAPGCCIGGDRFGNYEGLLPKADGRSYTECDIDTLGASSRGAKRIVFSNDGLVFYTDDHYESFELLYGDED